MKKLLVMIAFSLFSAAAFAAPSPQDVVTQMEAGNVNAAEVMTKEILKENPNSAKAHYYMGQILSREGKYQEAYDELNKAASLDKSLSFASNDRKFQSEMRKVEVNIGKAEAPAVSSETHIGRLIATILAIFAGIWIMVGIFSLASDKKKKAAKEKEGQRNLNEQMAKLMSLSEKANSVEVSLKLSDDPAKASKLNLVADIKDELNDLLVKNKKKSELADYMAISRIERSLKQLETGKSNGTYSGVASGLASAAQGVPHKHHYPKEYVAPVNSYQASPTQMAPVVNNYNGGSNNGLVDGLILGEMMSGKNHETVIEREVIREQPEEKFDAGSNQSDIDDRNNSIDTGSDSGFDSGSSNSFDSGGSSSFDSGGSSDSSS